MSPRKQRAREESEKKVMGTRYIPQGHTPLMYPEVCFNKLPISVKPNNSKNQYEPIMVGRTGTGKHF